jgi:hypothetical protein
LEIVDLPPERTAIGCRWVYATKTTFEGQFEKAKGQLVAQGFTQRPGMDYYDITSPVLKFDSLQALIALGATLNWEIELMDVKGAYLNFILEEEIYMKQPNRFDDGTGKVLKLYQALYGLKQVGHAWHQGLKQTLIKLDFNQSGADESIFIQFNKLCLKVIAVYVDDLAIFANTKEGMEQFKQII